MNNWILKSIQRLKHPYGPFYGGNTAQQRSCLVISHPLPLIYFSVLLFGDTIPEKPASRERVSRES